VAVIVAALAGGIGYMAGRASNDSGAADRSDILLEALLAGDLEYLEASDLDQPGAEFCEDYLDRTDGACVDVGDRVYFTG
jgi:hypothetical protein